MESKYDFNEINVLIKEYLQSLPNSEKVLQAFEKEEKQKQGSHIMAKYANFQINKVPQSRVQLQHMPKLYQLFIDDIDFETKEAENEENSSFPDSERVKPLTSREEKLSQTHSLLSTQHASVLQSSRQIFSIAINCLQQLHNIKDGNQISDPQSLGETIENYKIQLEKYDQILRSEGRCDRSKLFSETVMTEHRNKLIQAKVEGNLKGMIEVLLSLRVNALQISPELRKNLVYELIRNDIFLLQTNVKNQFIVELLEIQNAALQHSLLSLVSVIASTLKGVEYLIINGKDILVRIINLMKNLSENQKSSNVAVNVNLRFCVAILQKMSIKSSLIPIFIENDVIEFVIKKVEVHYSSTSPPPGSRVYTGEQHIFFLDFSTAMLANILHCKVTLEWLKNNRSICISLANRLIEAIYQKKMPPSVLMHLLISLSYIIKSPMLKGYVETPECNFSERISQFVEYFSKKPLNSNAHELVDDENGDIDKRTILDLCAHMFHPPKSGEYDDEPEDSAEQFIMSYEVGEFNDMRTDDRIKEFENEQGDLIFECFQDEENMFN